MDFYIDKLLFPKQKCEVQATVNTDSPDKRRGGYAGLGTPFFSVRYVSFFYVLKKECYVLFCSFLKFVATYGTQKNVTFFSVLF